MASRRFKFKPKPVISAVVRRPKDNLVVDEEGQLKDNDCSDVSFSAESVEKESSAISIRNELILKDNSKKLEDIPNEKFYEEKSEEIIKANVIHPVLNSSQNFNISIDSIVPKRTKFTDTQIYQKSVVHEVVESINTTDSQLIQNSSVQEEREKKCRTGDEISQVSDVCTVLKKIFTQPKSSVTASVHTVSENSVFNITAEVPKVVSKFGRFRHKPVLTSAVTRQKVEESNQNSSVDNVDNCNGLEKSKQSISLVNTENIVLEPQKVNNQSDCDILSNEISSFSDSISKPSSNDLSKPPQSPVKSVHKTFAFRPVPKLSDGVRRPSLQAIENEEDNNQKKEIKDNLKNYNELIAEGKIVALKKEQSFSKNKRQPRSQLSTFARMGQDAMDKLKLKFGDQCPAKNEMTMLDLIFYNPKSNPMTQKPVVSVTNIKRKLDLDSKESKGLIDEMLAEQSVDDVEESSNLAMPVPQLKVGPDGEVILDPQSLIIETTDARKNRENLESSEIVQETEGSYGSYVKKKTKRNEWSPEETLQFYRALNTLGTDFALMASLFPKRTRRDLKLKFKREERVNLHLIDKAVAHPMEFDFKALEEEMKIEAELIALKFAEQEQVKKEVKEAKEKQKRERETAQAKKKRFYGCHAFRAFTEEDIGEFRTTRNQNKKKAKGKKFVTKNKESKENCEDSRGDDKERIKNILTATRSGRIPKHLKNDIKTEIGVEIETKKRQINSSIIEENLKRRKDDENTSVYLNEDGTVPGLFEEPWDLTVQPIPDIEANILAGSQENASVSMISDLGSSFVEEINNMDSSTEDFLTTVDRFTEQLEHGVLPPYDSITKHKASKENLQTNSSLLNTRLLTESMKIIDQLTSNVGNDNNEMVYIENEGNENVNVDNLTQETVQSSAMLANEPILITLVPSEGFNETYNVEIQMPFKIRQKQMNLAKRFQSNNQDENNSCAEMQLPQRSSNVAMCVSKSKDIDQRFSNSEEVEQIKEKNSPVFGFDKSNPISTQSEGEICNSTDSVCQNISKDDKNIASNNQTSEEVNPVKSFILGADGVLRSDNLSMFIPRFEIITGDCLDINGSQETNLCPPSELVGSDNYIILGSIDETNTTPLVYSSHMAEDTECILGD